MSELVRAAGGVVGRQGPQGTEIVLVHRGRYEDWSLPKGKVDPGEHALVGAVREVWEETGVRGVPRLKLPSTRYLTGVPGVEKSVEYWAMRVRATDAFIPNDEVDEVRWVPSADAAGLLTYAHDRGVLLAYDRLPPLTCVVVLLRHAPAGERGGTPGPDEERPLDAAGRAMADALAPVLALFEPARLVSAAPARCQQTLAPLAAALGLDTAVDRRFDESADPHEAVPALRRLTREAGAVVVCSQDKLIPSVVAELTGADAGRYATVKGGGWVLSFAGARLVAAAALEPPYGPSRPQ
jgi:8-oxo-(d)GTP phosphatase